MRGAVADVFGLVLQNLSTLAVGYIIAFIFDWRMALLVTGLSRISVSLLSPVCVVSLGMTKKGSSVV